MINFLIVAWRCTVLPKREKMTRQNFEITSYDTRKAYFQAEKSERGIQSLVMELSRLRWLGSNFKTSRRNVPLPTLQDEHVHSSPSSLMYGSELRCWLKFNCHLSSNQSYQMINWHVLKNVLSPGVLRQCPWLAPICKQCINIDWPSQLTRSDSNFEWNHS
jgi:hypothetical protein